jgi:3-oxocholest-4-en-26-oate---CoA ligase
VLWRHEDFHFSMLSGGNPLGAPHLAVGELAAAARQAPARGYVITAPPMHGGGTLPVFTALLRGLKAVLSGKFDPAQTLRLVSAERGDKTARHRGRDGPSDR